MGSRQGTLNYAIANKKSLGDIQRVFAQRGYAPLTPRELSQLKNLPLASDNPLVRLGQNAIGDLGEMATGLSTFGTLGYQEARKIKQNPRAELKNLQRMATEYGAKRGVGGVAEDVANTLLSTYNTKVSDFGKLPAKKIIKNVGQGVYENPLFALADFAPATKLIPKGVKTSALEGLSKATKGFIPNEAQSTVNKIIKAQKLTNEVRTSPAQKVINEIKRNPKVDPRQISKNLIMGTREGNEATLKATEDFARVNNQINADLHTHFGLSPEVTKQEAVSKYILENVDPTREKGLNVDAIKKDMANYYNGNPSSLGIEELVEKGNKLYDEGKIRHISEALRPTSSNIITPDVEKASFLTQRVQGLTSPEELGDVLLDTYEYLNKQVTKSKTALDSFNEIAKTLGTKVLPNEAQNLTAKEILISPKILEKSLGKSLYGGNKNQVDSILKRMVKAKLNKPAIDKYGNDLYKVDKDLLRGLINSQTATGSSKLNALFKSSQLVTPKWLIENRIGNTILNTLEGVGGKEYAEANRLFGKYYKDIPRQLEQATSYAGYLGENFSGSKTIEGIQNAIHGTKKALQEKKPIDALANFNQVFSSPIVGLESSLEKVDRWANMIKQAKRYAKEKGLNPDKVIKSIKHNDSLFNELNAKVDASLGDYLGKNYFVSPWIHKLANWAVPFYKYPTQSGRVLVKQMIDRPLSYQVMAGLPTKVGNQIYNEQLAETGIGSDELGGLIRELGKNKFAPSKMERFGANPLTAPTEMAYQLLSGKGSDLANNLSPLFSDVEKVFTFRDKYGNLLTDPKYFNIGNRALFKDAEGKPTRFMVNEPTATDRAKLIGSLMANRFSVPTVQTNRVFLPIIAQALGEPYYSNYDTSVMGQVGENSIPYLMEGKSGKEGKQGLSELIGNMMGLRSKSVYPERVTASKSELKKAFRKYANQIRQKEGR